MVMKATPSEVFNGAMLSDAHIASNYGSPYFKIAQAGEERIVWLTSIEEALVSLGIESSGIKITDRINNFTKRPFKCCELLSRAHPIIRMARTEWYSDRKKKVPTNLKLTSGTLAHWFMGDGSSTRLKNKEYYVRAALCTQGFRDIYVYMLAEKLKVLGLNMNIGPVSKGKGLVLSVTSVSQVNRLMDIVEPYILSPYMYRVKRAAFSAGELRS